MSDERSGDDTVAPAEEVDEPDQPEEADADEPEEAPAVEEPEEAEDEAEDADDESQDEDVADDADADADTDDDAGVDEVDDEVDESRDEEVEEVEEVEEEAAPADDPDPADAARRRLLHALVPRATRGQLLAGLVCALLGFGVAVTARQTQVATLASLRESELVAVLDNVTQESARLEAQARSLQETLAELKTSSDRAPAARQAAQERLRVLGVLAGTLPATGPGIELEIPDDKLAINATELLETVQELRDAGAEAMQIGSVRVVASTSLVDDPVGIRVDGTALPPPYRLIAIGDPQTLAAALEIPGGVLETFRGKGVEGVVTTRQSLTVSALRQPQTPQYAHPAPAS